MPQLTTVTVNLDPRTSAKLSDRALFIGYLPSQLVRAVVNDYLRNPEFYELTTEHSQHPVLSRQRHLFDDSPDPNQTNFDFRADPPHARKAIQS